MGLQLYRRHSKACKANRPEDSRTGKFEEGRRNWKKCSCQIFGLRARRSEAATGINAPLLKQASPCLSPF